MFTRSHVVLFLVKVLTRSHLRGELGAALAPAREDDFVLARVQPRVAGAVDQRQRGGVDGERERLGLAGLQPDALGGVTWCDVV
jgi:hypothetical protein